jgi:hypothetical protein
MSVEQAILEVVRELPADKQQEMLNHLGIFLSAEDIEMNQREIWTQTPKYTG